jgi:hypothetical protein
LEDHKLWTIGYLTALSKQKISLKNLPLPLPKHFYELNFVDKGDALTTEGQRCLASDETLALRLFEQALMICEDQSELLQRQAKYLFGMQLSSQTRVDPSHSK